MATDNLSSMTLEEFKKRFDDIDKSWPYDQSKELTDDQLKEAGASDVTDKHKGMGIIVGKK